jgi:hypothetical protein
MKFLSALINKVKNAIMIARLHRRFSMKQLPILVEKRIQFPDPYKKRTF